MPDVGKSQANGNFTQWMQTQITELNKQITTSDGKLQELASGQATNLHQVMMSLEKAKTSFELTLQVRNKLLEGYQKIMRMQI